MTRFPLLTPLLMGLWLALTFYHVAATVPVQAPTKMTSARPSLTVNAQHFMPSVFGVAKRLPLSIPRGGAVTEPSTLQDVEAAILKASSEQKLVVIDFTASWCGEYHDSDICIC